MGGMAEVGADGGLGDGDLSSGLQAHGAVRVVNAAGQACGVIAAA